MEERRIPFQTLPTGWYQIAWSPEIEAGQAVPLRCFGQELVMFRGESGTAHVMDAYCGHLGAHFGHGGRVCGDDIICPFHGWRWDCSGRNVEIPYSSRVNRAQRIRTWPVQELGSLVMAWYDAVERPPMWDLPEIPEFEDSDRYPAFPHFTRRWDGVPVPPQFVTENIVDFAHQKYVHGAPEVAGLANVEHSGPVFRARHIIPTGNQEERSTWLTEAGEIFESNLDAEAWALGLMIARFSVDGSVHIQCQTPVDSATSNLYVTVLTRREDGVVGDKPTGAAERRLAYEYRQIERDLRIWEHMRYTDPAPYPPEEGRYYREFRTWARQFYPDPVES